MIKKDSFIIFHNLRSGLGQGGGSSGSAPALYHILSRSPADRNDDIKSDKRKIPPPPRDGSGEDTPSPRATTTTYIATYRHLVSTGHAPECNSSHTYASVPDVVSTSMIGPAATNQNASSSSSLPQDDDTTNCGAALLEDANAGKKFENGSVKSVTASPRVTKTGFIRNSGARYSLMGSRRWKSEDWDSEENLLSTLALKLRRKQSRPEITEL